MEPNKRYIRTGEAASFFNEPVDPAKVLTMALSEVEVGGESYYTLKQARRHAKEAQWAQAMGLDSTMAEQAIIGQ